MANGLTPVRVAHLSRKGAKKGFLGIGFDPLSDFAALREIKGFAFMTVEAFFANFGHLVDAPNGVQNLRKAGSKGGA